MEDVHRIVPALGGNESMSYFGVYDGHGGEISLYCYHELSSYVSFFIPGRHIVDFLETKLEENIIEELNFPDEASVLERLARLHVDF